MDGFKPLIAVSTVTGAADGVWCQKGTAITPMPARRPSSSSPSKRGFMVGSLLQFGNRDAVAGGTAGGWIRWHPEGMTEQQVKELVAAAIREHELRVALFSGAGGAALLAGTWHAIWMLRSWLL